NVADICPVGALTTKDFRFKIRVWFLEEAPGICTGCSNGCNVFLGVANNKVYRYVPRRNDAVNDTWICDAGRMTYKEIGAEDRLKRPAVRNAGGALEAVSFVRAVDEAAARLRRLLQTKGPSVIAGVASGFAGNEDLAVFHRFLAALGTDLRGVALPTGAADEILIKAEKAPNGEGARLLGFGDAKAVVNRIRGGGVEGLIVLGHDLLGSGYLGSAAELAKLDTVIVLDTHRSGLERVAHVVLPVRHAAEKDATYTNHAGRVQRSWPVIEPSFEAYAEGEVLARIAAALGLPGFDGKFDVLDVSRSLGELSPAFRGLDLESVGERGRPVTTTAGR
ncbi:MAG: molybdopterin-dependent oxidoreductase, partial [Acidimicrobiia bacterium]|nr:molybdopterin-dependent oxidoreductase [Acidimicrobiia bacterium]